MNKDRGSFRDTLDTAKRASVGQLLFKCARLLNEEALARMRARSGLQTLRASHISLVPHIDLEGTRLTDIASKLGVSKQAVGQLVEEMERMGMVERVPDPRDGRAKLVRFSTKGRKGMLVGLGVLGTVERELATSLGARRMRLLHGLLLRLEAALDRAAPPAIQR